jgi:hypothetical protein
MNVLNRPCLAVLLRANLLARSELEFHQRVEFRGCDAVVQKPECSCAPDLLNCAEQSAHGCPVQRGTAYLDNSFFTASLTTLPSTRMPCAANLAMAFFMTVPISFIVGDPNSEMAAFTPATISASPAAFGR